MLKLRQNNNDILIEVVNMENQSLEQIRISDIPQAMPLADSKVRNSRRVTIKGKPCIYFKDMECRTPMCDMKICEKCPEGGAVCLRINFIKSMLQKILIFFIGLIFLSEI